MIEKNNHGMNEGWEMKHQCKFGVVGTTTKVVRRMVHRG
jgi:hypothetical protein